MVNGSESSPSRMDSGVPQGSILGLLLFVCYINNLPNVLSHSSPHIYAVDTAIVTHSNDPECLSHSLNEDARQLDDQFKHNRLYCNVAKTKSMMFCNIRFNRRDSPLTAYE